MNLRRLSQLRSKSSLERFLKRHYKGSFDAFFTELNAESDRLIRTDLKKSQELTQSTAGLEHLITAKYQARLYKIWGRHYHISGDYRKARKYYSMALSLFEGSRDGVNRARVQKALVDVLCYQGKYDDALQAGRESMPYFKRVKSDIDYAQILTNLGNMFHRLDQNKKALNYYDRAYKIFKNIDNDYAMAVVQFNRGNIYSNLNDLPMAEKLYRQSADIYRRLGMDLAACQADYSLAYIDFLKGRYSESLNSFAEAAECFRKLGDRRCLALTELDQTEVNLHLNLFSQTIHDALDVAKEFGRLRMSYERAKACYFAAAAYFAYGDFSNVARLARKAYHMFDKENNQSWKILCQYILAKVESREGKLPSALKTFRKIAAFYKNRGDVRRYHDVKLTWLEALISSKHFKAAAAVARGIEKSIGQLAGYQKFVYFMLQGDRNLILGRQQSASQYYRWAVGEAQRLQATIFPDEIRRFFWMDKLAAYNKLAAIYLNSGRERKAYELLEESKVESTIISDEIIGKTRHRKIPAHLEAERMQLKAYLRKAIMPIGSEERSTAAIGRMHSAEHRLWKIERSLREADDSGRISETVTHLNIDDIQPALARREALIHFVCRNEAVGAFVIGREGFEYVAFDTNVDVIRGLLARLYFLITRTVRRDGDDRIIANLISTISIKIWHPLLRRLEGCRKLVMIPDGILCRMPLYLLNNGDGSTLIERYNAYLYSSSSTFAKSGIGSVLSGKFGRAAILVSGDDNLPGATAEGMTVSRRLPQARLMVAEEANCSNLFDSLEERNGLVHLVAHAAQSYENHLFSQILLSDGPVYPFDLISRTINSRLVVLSGCQTGDPGLYYSGDSISLAQSFVAAGAKSVIASYWPVSDEVTCLLMDTFYKELSSGSNVYKALIAAILEMRTVSGDIRLWAPFYLLCR